jgi:N-acetylneuraminic acid mutarotase
MGQDGRIFVVGGCCQQGVQPPAGVAEVYDPPRNVWRIIAPIPAGRSPMAAAAGSDGRIYAIGGTLPCCFGPPTLNMVDVYDPGTDRWETVAPVPTARQDLAAVIGSDGRIYAIGGRSVAEENFNTVEAYTPSGQ